MFVEQENSGGGELWRKKVQSLEGNKRWIKQVMNMWERMILGTERVVGD